MSFSSWTTSIGSSGACTSQSSARGIALQSVAIGLGLSMVGMIAAAYGWLTPVQGAVAQEAIDVAVILNALRPLLIDPHSDPRWAAASRPPRP